MHYQEAHFNKRKKGHNKPPVPLESLLRTESAEQWPFGALATPTCDTQVNRKFTAEANPFVARTKHRLRLSIKTLKEVGIVADKDGRIERAVNRALYKLSPKEQKDLLNRLFNEVEAKIPAYVADLKYSGAYKFLRSGFKDGSPVPFSFKSSEIKFPSSMPDEQNTDEEVYGQAAMFYNYHRKKVTSTLPAPDKKEILYELALAGSLNYFVLFAHHEFIHWKQDLQGAFMPHKLANYCKSIAFKAAHLTPAATVAVISHSAWLTLLTLLSFHDVSTALMGWLSKHLDRNPSKRNDNILIIELQAYDSLYSSPSMLPQSDVLKSKIIDTISRGYGRADTLRSLLEVATEPSEKEELIKKESRYIEEAKIILNRAYGLIRSLRLLGHSEENITALVAANRVDGDGICTVLSDAVDNLRVSLGLRDELVFQATMKDLEDIHLYQNQILRSQVQRLLLERLGVKHFKSVAGQLP